jgi:hypothetical protein
VPIFALGVAVLAPVTDPGYAGRRRPRGQTVGSSAKITVGFVAIARAIAPLLLAAEPGRRPPNYGDSAPPPSAAAAVGASAYSEDTACTSLKKAATPAAESAARTALTSATTCRPWVNAPSAASST